MGVEVEEAATETKLARTAMTTTEVVKFLVPNNKQTYQFLSTDIIR
jgi:hypothetical protein